MTRDLVQAALADVDRLKEKLELLLSTYRSTDNDQNSVRLKRDDGRLTEAGIRQLRNLIDAGRTDVEIARELDITPPGVSHQRQRYVMEKFAPRRRGGG